MLQFLSDPFVYSLIKAFHMIAVIAWMAGLLYLPRLFVYHAEADRNSQTDKTFQTMERRLLRIIMLPSLLLTWAFGLLMLAGNPVLLFSGWMHAKLVCVIAMTFIHHLYGRWRLDFARGRNIRTPGFYRLWNEAPTVLMIIIVILVIVKPF